MHLPRGKQNKANIDCFKKAKGNALRLFFKGQGQGRILCLLGKLERTEWSRQGCVTQHQVLGFPGEGVGGGAHANVLGRALCVRFHRPCSSRPASQ